MKLFSMLTQQLMLTSLVVMISFYDLTYAQTPQHTLNLGIVGYQISGVNYILQFAPPIDIPSNSYIVITTPITPASTSLSLSNCSISSVIDVRGLYFNPATYLTNDPLSSVPLTITSDPAISITSCVSNQGNVIIGLGQALTANNLIKIQFTVGDPSPNGLNKFGLSIQSNTGNKPYTYFQSTIFEVVPYFNSIPSLTSSSVKMDYLDYYAYPYYSVISSNQVQLEDVFNSTIVSQYRTIKNVLTSLQSAKTYLQSLPSNVAQIVAGGTLYTTSFTPTMVGFTGGLTLTFTTPSIIPANSMLDITLPNGWITDPYYTQCYSVSGPGINAVFHSACQATNGYLYFYLLDQIAASTPVSFNITFVTNPQIIFSTTQNVAVRIFDINTGIVTAMGLTISGLTTIPGTISTFTVVPTNNFFSTPLIFQQATQYLTFTFSSNDMAIPSNSKIVISTTSASSGYGPIPNSCTIYNGLTPIQYQRINCDTSSVAGSVQITNIDTIPLGTSVSIGILHKNLNAASQSFTIKVYLANVGVSPITYQTSESYSQSITVTLQAQPTSAITLKTGSSASTPCTDDIALPFTSKPLCIHFLPAQNKAGTLTITASPYITYDTSSTLTCSYGSSASSPGCTCNEPSQTSLNSQLSVNVDNTNQGTIAISSVIFTEFLGGSDSISQLYEFYITFTDASNTITNGMITLYLTPPNPPDVIPQIANNGTDTHVTFGLLYLNGAFNPSISPYLNVQQVAYSIYFNPDVFDFSMYNNNDNYSCIDAESRLSCYFVAGSSASANAVSYLNWPQIVIDNLPSDSTQITLTLAFNIKTGQAVTPNSLIAVNSIFDPTLMKNIPYGYISLSLNSTKALENLVNTGWNWLSSVVGSSSSINFDIATTTAETQFPSASTPNFVLFNLGWQITSTNEAIVSCSGDDGSPVSGFSMKLIGTGGTTSSILALQYSEQITSTIPITIYCDNLQPPSSNDLPAYSIFLTDTDGISLAYINIPAVSNAPGISPASIYFTLETIDYQTKQLMDDINAFYPITVNAILPILATDTIKVTFDSNYPTQFTAANSQKCLIFPSQTSPYSIYTTNYISTSSSPVYTATSCSFTPGTNTLLIVPGTLIAIDYPFRLEIFGIKNPTSTTLDAASSTSATFKITILDSSSNVKQDSEYGNVDFEHPIPPDNENLLQITSEYAPYSTSYTNLQIQYNVPVPLYGMESIQINLGSNIKTANSINDVVVCSVTFSGDPRSMGFNYDYESESESETELTPLPQPLIGSCDSTNLNPLSIELLQPNLKQGNINIYLQNVQLGSTSDTMNAQVVVNGGATLVNLLSTPIDAFSLLHATSIQYILAINPPVKSVMADYHFTFKTGVDLADEPNLIINFPSTFDFSFSESFTCDLNSIDVGCYQANQYQIYINVLPSMSAATQYVLTISGIINPLANIQPLPTIQLYAYSDIDALMISITSSSASLELTDPIINNYIMIMNIAPSTNASYAIAYTNFTITLNGAISASIGDILRIIYPEQFDIATSSEAYTVGPCQTIDPTNVITNHACTTYGNEIKIALASALSLSTTYILKINNILNPFGGAVDNFYMDLLDLTQQTLKLKNYNVLDKYSAPVYTQTGQMLQTFDIYGNSIYSIYVTLGVVTTPIAIAAPDKSPLKSTMSITYQSTRPQQSTLTFSPSSGAQVNLGQLNATFTVCSSATTSPNQDYIGFTKNEVLTSFYMVPFFLTVYFNSTQSSITVPKTITIPSGGISKSQLITLQYGPCKSLVITLSTTQSGVTISPGNSFSFGYGQTTASFFITLASSVAANTPITITYAKSGPSAGYYTFSSSTSTITVTAAVTTAPNVTINKLSSTSAITLVVKTNVDLLLYYQASLTASNDDFPTIQTLVSGSTSNPIITNSQQKFSGSLYVEASTPQNPNQTASITNLTPLKNYSVVIYPQVAGNQQLLTAKTMNFYFQSTMGQAPAIVTFGVPGDSLDNTSYNNFICILAQTIGVPSNTLIGSDNSTCNQTAFLLERFRNLGLLDAINSMNNIQSLTDPVQSALNDNSQTLINNYKINPQYLQGLSSGTFNNLMSNLAATSDTSSQTYAQNLQFFIMPDPNNPQQNLKTLLNNVQNTNQLAYVYAQNGFNPTNLPILKSSGIIAVSGGSSKLIPLVNDYKVFSGNYSIILQVELTSPGTVYAIALTQNSTAPTSFQVFSGLNASSANAIAANYSIVSSSDPLPPARVTLANLTNQSYDIYFTTVLYVSTGSLINPNVIKTNGSPMTTAKYEMNLNVNMISLMIMMISVIMMTRFE